MSPEERARIEQVMDLAATAMRAACQKLGWYGLALEFRQDGRVELRLRGGGSRETDVAHVVRADLFPCADCVNDPKPGRAFLDTYYPVKS